MDDRRRRRVKEVFLAAREVAATEREVRLRELCESDDQLWEEVSSLLEYDAKQGLESSVSGAVSDALSGVQDPDLSGSRIGEFVLIHSIGKGGMGMVWEAEQDHPHRRVAIKVLRRGLASPGSVRRFEHEVELLGRLQHPSIAQVYAAGTFEHGSERVPYFVMELVSDALTLDAFVRAKDLSLRERVRLFLSVCEAVHHGHQRGVIHRDLKPTNILVDSEGLPKVIDFGVARATNSDIALTTQHTHAGELVGTLSYMSPEQCDADPAGLDSRTDIYSLGVVLYELVCSRPPYDLREKSITAAALVIREQEPEAPSRIDRHLRGDLEAIVLKCSEKDRQRRYLSAADLAADLRRYLAGDPVDARLPGLWRKTLRWIGRHPILTTAIACVSLVTISVGSLWLGISLAAIPWRIQIQGSGKEANLVSIAGQVLKRWEPPESGWIRWGTLLERPEPFGGGKIAALGLDFHPRSGELCFFEMSNLETPCWTSAAHPLQPPRDEPVRPGTRFIVENGLAADVFPEIPGEELVVCHRMLPYSATAVRIYDLSGALQYEAWHDGGLGGLRWLPGPRILIASGLNSERSWTALGVDTGDSQAIYPAVVFALRPERGRSSFDEFVVHRGSRLDPSLLWYEWLGPTEHVAALDSVLPTAGANGGSWSGEEYVQIDLCTEGNSRMQPPPLFSIILDAKGDEVDRIVSDPYWRWERAGSLPSASVYQFHDFTELPFR